MASDVSAQPSSATPGMRSQPNGARRLRVLHVVRQYAPARGGLETYVEQLTARQRRRHHVHVLTLNKVFGTDDTLPRFERLDGVPVHRVGWRGTRQFFTPFLSPGWFKKFDIVHMHCTDQLLELVALARSLGGPPYVVTSHGLFFHTESLRRAKEAYLRGVTRFSLKGASAVLAISGNDADIMAKVGVKSELMRNPIEPFAGPLATGEDLIYIGRLSQNKRVELLIDFMAHVRRVDPGAHLHVVGGDPEGLGDGLRQRAWDAGVADGVTFHGFVSREQAEDLCARSRFIASSSRYEGFGLSIIEGMSKGLIPVVHDNAAFRETVELAGMGLLTDFHHPEAAARDFLAWRASDAPMDRAGARAFALTHSWDHVAARLEEIYADALA